jgi:hypothetical protein
MAPETPRQQLSLIVKGGAMMRFQTAVLLALLPAVLALAENAAPEVSDQVKLKSGQLIMAKIQGISGDYLVCGAGDETRRVKVESVAKLQTGNSNPQFWKQLVNSSLKCGNGLLAFDCAVSGRSLDVADSWFNSVLDYPGFSQTALDLGRANKALADLNKAKAAAKARCDSLMGGAQTTIDSAGASTATGSRTTQTTRPPDNSRTTVQSGQRTISGANTTVITDNRGVMSREAADAWAQLQGLEADADQAARESARLEGALSDMCFAIWKQIGITAAVQPAEAEPAAMPAPAEPAARISPVPFDAQRSRTVGIALQYGTAWKDLRQTVEAMSLAWKPNDGALDKQFLSGIGILIITGGQAARFTPEEVALVRDFVSTGGGCLCAGQAWSFVSKTRTAESYPLNAIGRALGFAITGRNIGAPDPTSADPEIFGGIKTFKREDWWPSQVRPLRAGTTTVLRDTGGLTIILRGELGAGRFVAAGHDGFFRDNPAAFKAALQFLAPKPQTK